MRSSRLLIVALSLLLLLAAADASAQSTRRPDLNLFGRGLRDPQQSLGVRGNLGGTFYDRLSLDGQPVPDPTVSPDHGWGAFGSAALIYNLRLGAVSFDGTLGTFATYYPGLAKPLRVKSLPGAGARVGWQWELSDRTRLSLSSDLRVRPLYAEAFLPGGTGAAFGVSGIGDPFAAGADVNSAFLPRDEAFVDGSYLSAAVSSSLTHQLSRRWSASAEYRYQHDVLIGAGNDEEQPRGYAGGGTRQEAGAALHVEVLRGLSVRGGYRYSETRVADFPPYRIHTADIGIDYSQGGTVQLARHTRMTFDAGAGAFADQTGGQRYRLTGSIGLTHDIGRTWSSGARYMRGIDSSQLLFREPLLTDTFSAYINGLVSRRVGFHASSTVQGGALAFGSEERHSLRSASSTGIQTALGRHLALGLDYSFYYYRFDSAFQQPGRLPARSASQGVYVYLSAWAPIFQRGGRPNATR